MADSDEWWWHFSKPTAHLTIGSNVLESSEPSGRIWPMSLALGRISAEAPRPDHCRSGPTHVTCALISRRHVRLSGSYCIDLTYYDPLDPTHFGTRPIPRSDLIDIELSCRPLWWRHADVNVRIPGWHCQIILTVEIVFVDFWLIWT